MSNNYFSPNKSNQGGAVSFKANPQDGAVYARFMKQKAWENGKGVFAGGESISIKFGPSEIAGIARAGKTKSSFDFYHSFDGGAVSGRFSYYKIEPKEDGQKAREGFGWSIKKDNVEIKVSLTLNDAFQLALWAEHVLGLIFNADIESDEAEYRQMQEKKQAENNKKTAPANKTQTKKAAKAEPQPETDTPAEEGSEGEEDVPF